MEWIDASIGFVVGVIFMKWITLYMLRGYKVKKVKPEPPKEK